MKREFVATSNSISAYESKHLQIAREAAAEGMVLLKNINNCLPIKPSKIALFGNGARRTVKGGTGSGDVNVRQFSTVEDGLENAGFVVQTKDWLDAYDKVQKENETAWMQSRLGELRAIAEQKHVPLYVAAVLSPTPKAKPEPMHTLTLNYNLDTIDNDIAVYAIARNSGEGTDRFVENDFDLTATEEADITLIAKKFKKCIVVLNVGGAVNVSNIAANPNIGAILIMSQAGSAGGDALCDILTGKATPSGKLAMTWAKKYADYPYADEFAHLDGDYDDSYYKEGIYVGYRYFDSFNIEPMYPFGYGLSYTDFETKYLSAKVEGNDVTINVLVKNIGKCAGKEVVQVYFSAPQGQLNKPYQELIGYQKTMLLQPSANETLKIHFKISDLASYSEAFSGWVLEKGEYLIRVGNSSRDTKIVLKLDITQDIITVKTKNVFGKADFTEITTSSNMFTYPSEEKEGKSAPNVKIDTKAIPVKAVDYSDATIRVNTTSSINEFITYDMVKKGQYSIGQLIDQLSPQEMALLCCGAYKDGEKAQIIGNITISVPGAAGETTAALNSRGIPVAVMADGPAGLRLTPKYYVDKDEKFVYDEPEMGEIIKLLELPEPPKPDLSDAEIRYQYATAIPIATSLAQTWNNELIRQIGQMVSDEMLGFGIHIWLAPGMNIQKNPLCGRNFEYFSEDPLVSGKCAAAMTKGVQSNEGACTTIKHYACNNQETHRMSNNAHVSERALREIYLKGFQVAVADSDPFAIMSSYNLLNGEHTATHYALLTSVLRDEWNYSGIVMTDWGTTRIGAESSHGNFKQKYKASDQGGCIKAGNDIIMPGTKADADKIVESIDNKSAKCPITLGELKVCATRMIKLFIRLGL